MTIDYYFVGYDPGTTSGVALVDLNGDVIASLSGRSLKEGEIVRFIMEYGKPIVIACDVRRTPGLVKKLAGRFEVGVFHPKNNVGRGRKRQILDCEKRHERDAAVGAILAYRECANKIRNLQRREIGEIGVVMGEMFKRRYKR